MKRLFLDTNFIIDYFIRDSYQSDSENLLLQGYKMGLKFYVSYLSMANFAYILRKQPKEVLYEMIKKCCEVFNIVDCNSKQIEAAISLNASDFEDALQYQAALEAKCDCIITRNSKDFTFSILPTLTATEFTDKYLR